MSRGRVILEDWEARTLAEREATRVTARCLWCNWNQEGTVLETRDAYLKHRTTKHPEIVPKTRRPRNRLYRMKVSNSDLDDNIAAAREQGAAMWAGRL